MDAHAIERLTSAELRAMSLLELGNSLNDAMDAGLALSRALQAANSKLAELKVEQVTAKSFGSGSALAYGNSITTQKAVVENLKIRMRCVRDIRSSLQTMIRSVGTI